MIGNKRTGQVLARDELYCDNTLSLAMGLRFRGKRAAVLDFGRARRVMLDMWFVFYPIDVLFLDEEKRVVEIKRNLRPWSNYRAARKACYAVEIPCYKALNARLDDKLVFTL